MFWFARGSLGVYLSSHHNFKQCPLSLLMCSGLEDTFHITLMCVYLTLQGTGKKEGNATNWSISSYLTLEIRL